jgi:hypothetical protein
MESSILLVEIVTHNLFVLVLSTTRRDSLENIVIRGSMHFSLISFFLKLVPFIYLYNFIPTNALP